ncbi:hypothetical protein V8C40DRAFT_255228 [Trichoderma camerunense]
MRRAGSIYSSADSLGNIKTGNLSTQFCSFFVACFSRLCLSSSLFPLVTLKMLLGLGQRKREQETKA